MADALLGIVNPCGKLAESWPHRLEDNPSYPYYPSKERTCEYREGLYVGYRYYDTAGVPVRYPFGHGLSYAKFVYSDLRADQNSVTFTLTNIGSADGAEITQVYISCPGSAVFRPKKELKGFKKVFLKAGESKTVTIPLDAYAFRYFNTVTNAWDTESGSYVISVAASVSDVRLSQTVTVSGSDTPRHVDNLPSYSTGQILNVSDKEFEQLLGHPIPDGSWSSRFDRNDALCQLQFVRTLPAQLIHNFIKRLKDRAETKCPPDLNLLFIYNMTFRGICKLTAGMFSSKMVDDLVLAVNGHFFRGIGQLIADHFRNRRRCRTFQKKLEEAKSIQCHHSDHPAKK